MRYQQPEEPGDTGYRGDASQIKRHEPGRLA
jgi:hypothetical protein